MALRLPLIFAITLSACHLTLQSPSPYSLQPAVEALSDREAQIALRDELQNDNIIDNDDFDDYGGGRGQHSPNNALERYFSRTSPDYDDYFGYRKRALFRKRGSVFRERSRLPSQRPQQQAQLTEKFLKAIGDEREREREDDYREELHKLWNRYQKEENGIERELFNENDIESDYPINFDENDKKKKRQRGEVEVAPVYWNEKRTMPLLPWLPASRKKRFPVTKRSPKMTENELVKASASAIVENDEKIAQDLRGIFGAVNDDANDKRKKKKRSMEETTHDKNNGKEHMLEANHQQQHSSMMMMAPHHSHDNDDKKRNLKKRSSSPDDENDDDEENDNEEGGDDAADDEESPNDSNEEEDKKKKKKREAAKKSLEVVGAESFPEKKGVIKKKSVEWSSLFGIDRKKKSFYKKRETTQGEADDYESPDYNGQMEDEYEDADVLKKKKRSAHGLIFHPLQEIEDRRKKECEPWWMCESSDLGLTNYDIDKRKKKRTRGDDRLDAMDEKLNAMKNLIIEDTARYFSHHDDNLNPSETKNMRNELADRLATAYSLDKMRKAIARLKQSMAVQRTLEKNLLESPVSSVGDAEEEDDDKKKAKRVAIKKEKVEFDNNGHEIDSPAKKVSDGDKNDLNNDDDGEEKKKKKKKRSQKKSNIMTNEVNDDELAPMSEGYMGGKVFQNDCPLLSAIEKRCRGIDILTGDTHHNLLEACGAHQLCYLCGDSETQCDYGYLYEIQDTCGHNVKCKLNGAQALKALRSFSGAKIGPRECIRNPCLNSALRSLGY